MKKSILLTVYFLAICFTSLAGKFVLIPVNESNNLESLFNNKDLKIHYYCDDFVLATAEVVNFEGIVILDENAFADVGSYAIVYCFEDEKEIYLSRNSVNAKLLYSGDNFLIMKPLSFGIMPAKNDGLVIITDTKAKLPKNRFNFPVVTETDTFIQFLNEKVNTDTLMSYVQHLQDYGTRAYNEPEAYQAQDWMKAKFESWSLDIEVQNFTVFPTVGVYPHSTSSGNVIAVQPGTLYPDEYIICGAHYDSWSWFPLTQYVCPGADDNATGTATVLEMARILSQYEFERTIIYCCFSAEEFGKHGSTAYASRCQQQEMNILGYFNIDMSGYLNPGDPIRIHLMYPFTAAPLADYLKNINDVYFQIPITSYPSFDGGGNSDHVSFNQNGYQGIWTFENPNPIQPYIHTANDTIGLSVNNQEQVNVFTQVNLASIATLATPLLSLTSPANCVATFFENKHVEISWDAPTEITPNLYCVYRDSVKISETVEIYYFDIVEDYEEYCYTVTAVYNAIQSEFSNAACGSAPVGIMEYSSKFKIYPNPARDVLNLIQERITNYELREGEIEIFDVNGKKQSSHHLIPSSSNHIINISHLSAGAYFVRIAKEVVGKFVKE